MSLDLFFDVLLDGVKDTLQLVPFLFLTYLVMEALEHGTAGKAERLIAHTDKSGPVVGALLGALPQCGFSAMAATLYAGRIVSAGTLVAVILSTSDELIPVFLANQASTQTLASILVTKALIGLVVGLVVDVILRVLHRAGDGHPHIAELCARAHCHCASIDEAASHEMARSSEQTTSGHEHHHGHDHAHEGPRWWHVVRAAIIHTVEVTAFIFLVTVVFGLAIEYVGEDALAGALSTHPIRAIFLAALIGLIPNCGASVAITQLYLGGSLATGPMLAGLLVSGGMGLLVLFRTNADHRQNVEIAAFIYAVGVFVGIVAASLGIVI